MVIDPAQFTELKISLLDLFNVSRDALHIHIGLAVFLGLWLIFGRRWGGLLAWLIVLGMAIYGEILDHANELPRQYHHTEPEHRRDVINTMIWPSLLLILGLFMLRGKNPDADKDDLGADNALIEEPASDGEGSDSRASKAAASESGDLPDQPFEKPPSV